MILINDEQLNIYMYSSTNFEMKRKMFSQQYLLESILSVHNLFRFHVYGTIDKTVNEVKHLRLQVNQLLSNLDDVLMCRKYTSTYVR